jgi:predicted phage replisome organizer
MSKAKRYYWLKLKDNFFDEEDIKLVESMPNGKDYIIFFLKLQLKSIKTEGILKYKNIIPYTPEMLSTITNTNVDVVKGAIDLFKELKMLEIWDDGTIFMNEVINLIGSESDSAERVRRLREKNSLQCNAKMLQSNADVTKCNTEIEKELDIDIEKDTTLSTKPIVDRVPHKQIMDLYHSICTTLPKIKEMTKARQETIRGWYKSTPDIKLFEDYFKKVQASDFLTGRDGKWLKCGFDWIIKPSNRQKVLEGNYDNKNTASNKESGGVIHGGEYVDFNKLLSGNR